MIFLLPLDVNVISDVGPAFLTGLASVVASVALLLKTIPALRRVESKVNGQLDEHVNRNRELRDALDEAHSENARKDEIIRNHIIRRDAR